MQDQQQEQSSSKIPKDPFTNSFICTKDNSTVECIVKEVLSGIPPPCKCHPISSSLWSLPMCQCISFGRPVL